MKRRPVVLITGASRGIGRAIAVRAAHDGYSVAVHYRGNDDAAAETLRLCRAAATSRTQHFSGFRADLSRARERAALTGSVIEGMGGLDALVNNAGAAPARRDDMLDTTEASFSDVLALNLHASFFLTQDFAKYRLSQSDLSPLPGGPSVLFISSVSAELASLNRPEYCVSKAGLSMTAHLWALRLAEHGITVLELRPGIMATDMTAGVRDKYEPMISAGLVPQKRWGDGDDVARVCSAVWRGDLPFSTGAVIHVDGGLHLGRL